ncbi:1-acyl-sn-glycerol-3-phosphate acyltransferase [Marinilabiliaceae bacterium ANBcel2]|nr:1-acyl-sn-glycerol-3-phosphate acyltransferase [Marinilabiliaceae bacterium ANBcel2]
MAINSRENREQQQDLINIKRVISSKNPALLKVIPWFIIKYLEKITHQDDINKFINDHKEIKGIAFAHAILKSYQVSFESHGLENIDANGRYLFAANHPLGGVDGIALIASAGEKFTDLKFPVNDILMNIKGLDSIFLPINKHGGHPKEAAKLLEKAYASASQILMFPAGLVSRKQKGGVIKDLEWKKSFVKKAIQHKRDIVPVHITGKNSNFFYNLANIRKKAGIKANIEMLYLADEFYKQKGEKLNIRYGTPIPHDRLKSSESVLHWTQKIKEIVYDLPKIN